MSITTILATSTTGLMAAQQGLRTVSDNIANVNTPGYVRKVVEQTSLVTMGVGSGVDVIGVQRVIDRYLQTASLNAAATAGRATVGSEMLDRTQSLFGDPSSENNFFNRLDAAFSEFAALGNDPSSSLQRSEALSTLQSFFDEANRIAGSLTDLQAEADTRLKSQVDRTNELLGQIATLNGEISRAKYSGTDASGAENIQAQLVNELSGLINFQFAERSTGGLVLRTADGMLLADEESAVISYNSSTAGAGFLSIVPAQSGGKSFEANFSGGEVIGLLQMRDQAIPGVMAQLTEFVSKAAQEINRAHNAYTAVPAPASLSGRDVGVDLPTAVNGFTGTTNLTFMNAAGVVQNNVAIDFSAGTISVNGGPGAAFTPANFLTSLNTALGGIGSASFANGALSISAASGGVAVADDATTPSTKAGQGFSQFFGLNDLVRSTSYAPFDTGLSSTDTSGFIAGQTLTLRVSDGAGARLRDVTVTVPAGTVGDLLNALNAPGTGVGGYGQFSLDANGRMSFAPAGNNGASVSVLEDNTSWGASGPSLSSLFGVGPTELKLAAGSFSINQTVRQDPSLLALAKVNLGALAGTAAIAVGDGGGGVALSRAGEQATRFSTVNGFNATSTSVSRYATEFAGLLGRRSASAETQRDGAEAVMVEAENRRTSYEGVNMDEELVRLTTYQQAFNASARLIQAAGDMYDTLIGMVTR